MKKNWGAGSSNASANGPKHVPKPWRVIDWSEETLKRDVETFVPLQGQNKLRRMNILLLGQISAGKSSIVNTITSIFRDHASHKAESTNSDRSVTRITGIKNEGLIIREDINFRGVIFTEPHAVKEWGKEYRQYQIRSSKGDELAFRLCDTRGIEDKETIRTEDIQRMIYGEKLDMETSEPSYRSRIVYWKVKLVGFVRWMNGWFSRAKSSDCNTRAYCVVYVIDGSNIQTLPDTVENYFKECRKLMKQIGGIPEIVVLTKADDCCKEVNSDIKAISHSLGIKTAVQTVVNKFGFLENQIYPVVNMLKEVKVRRETSILFLTALRQMLFEGRDYIQDMLDKKKLDIGSSPNYDV